MSNLNDEEIKNAHTMDIVEESSMPPSDYDGAEDSFEDDDEVCEECGELEEDCVCDEVEDDEDEDEEDE